MWLSPRQAETSEAAGTPKAALWNRIARLHPRCRISLESVQAFPMLHGSLYWRVRISLRGSPDDGIAIVLLRPKAAEALEQAVEEAEARGWHRAEAPPLA